MDIQRKLEILADAAKYDASCSSSGGVKRTSRDSKGTGSLTGAGICHSFTPDGRCVSLLKILLTNYCTYDCLYCVNRVSSDVQRARFTPDEVVQLTLDFYRRNYIEGLFLSSGIIRNPDYTMEQVVAVARSLRVEHEFKGYIHLKTIPEASQALIDEAGKYADRISINIELPRPADLTQLAPEKNLERIQSAMGAIKERIDESKEDRRNGGKGTGFAAAGQSTQMIIGATDAADHDILSRATMLYSQFKLRRVYYSAFSPIQSASRHLPLVAPPLIREHRLYQADWLMRFYGFKANELTNESAPNLSLRIDPKLAWALRNRHSFPINLNKAPRSLMLRIPGLGVKNTEKILQARRWSSVRLQDLIRLRVPLKKVMPFIEVADHHPQRELDSDKLLARLAPPTEQMDLFRAPETSVLDGQL
ncbi:MAG: putative DNA modification/repair radical SAM protein [Verrucomicrobiota bacterium]